MIRSCLDTKTTTGVVPGKRFPETTVTAAAKQVFVLLCVVLCLVVTAFGSGKSAGVDPRIVRYELKDILSAREYNTTANNWLNRILGETIGHFIKWIGEHLSFGGAGDLVSSVLAWIVVVAFVVLLAIVIRRLYWIGKNKSLGEDTADLAEYDLPSAKPLILEAAKLAELGDYRGAFRSAYLACISYLDEIKALRFERSRTNWEYLRELKRGGFEMPYNELHPITMDFDRKIYGREDCDKQDYVRVLETYDRILREVAQ